MKNKKRKKLFYSFLADNFSSRTYLQVRSLLKFGRLIDFDNPQTFNDWLHWSKIYNFEPVHTIVADKYAVRDFVAQKIGPEHLVPLIGCYQSAEEVNFDTFPDKFVIKSNHGSNQLIMVTDKSKLDIAQTRAEMTHWLNTDFFRYTRELQYRDIPRRIVAEELLTDSKGELPFDYKFHCFNGRVRAIQVDLDRFGDHHRNYYDRDWNFKKYEYCAFHRFGGPRYKIGRELEAPKNLSAMIAIAEKLSAGFKYVRVDLYAFDNRIFFGELTLHHGSGWLKFSPKEWDYTWRKWLDEK